MTALNHVLLEPNTRQLVISDCVSLVKTEISRKSGLTGVAIKAAFTVVNKVDPRFVHLAVSSLIDEFIDAMDPTYASYKRDGKNGLRAYWIRIGNAEAELVLDWIPKRLS